MPYYETDSYKDAIGELQTYGLSLRHVLNNVGEYQRLYYNDTTYKTVICHSGNLQTFSIFKDSLFFHDSRSE